MSKPKGAPQALAQARQQLAQAKTAGMPEACIRILEEEVQKEEAAMKLAQPMGQRMDQARARFRRAVETGEKAVQVLQKAQAQQEILQAQTDLATLMKEAPLPQVNKSLVRNLEALTGIVENLWNPGTGPPSENLVNALQESRRILQASSAILAQGVDETMGDVFVAEPSTELWEVDEDTWDEAKTDIELAGRRATVAETGEWIELLRLYVRDMLSFEIDARGDGTHTMQQSATLKTETMRASDKMDSSNIRAAQQILQTNARAPQNRQTASEVHSLDVVDADDQEKLKEECRYCGNWKV